MKTEELSFIADDGKSIHVYRWSPDGPAKACILLAHGMAEHAGRYARLARTLTASGYEIWAPDHRGHGKTASEAELGWFARRDGLTRVMEDLHGLALRVKAERPGLKLFLFGHSMGSFIAQGFISRHGGMLAGCVLSGTAGRTGPIAGVGRVLAGLGCLIAGEKARTPLLDKMSFGAFNKAFMPVRTPFDWLSRDPAEVDAYIADPRCGFICTFGLFRDLLGGLAWMQSPAAMAAIPKGLPLYLFAGEKDPVGAATGSFDALAAEYRSLGIVDLEARKYPGGRHEMLNDTAREQVTAELLAWFERH